MSVLQNWEFTPSRIAGVFRYLAAQKTGVPEAKLHKLFQPDFELMSLQQRPSGAKKGVALQEEPEDDEGDDADDVAAEVMAEEPIPEEEAGESAGERREPPKRHGVRKTIAEGVAMRLLDRDPEKKLIRLSDALTKDERKPELLRQTITRRLLPAKFDLKDRNHDFAKICAWFLSHPIASLPQGSGDFLARVKDQFPDLKFNTSGRYNAWNYWARYCGVLWSAGAAGLAPDPTALLEWLVPTFMKPTERLTAGKFMERLASSCAVLDGGELRRQVQPFVSPLGQNVVSESLTLALLRLDLGTIIKIDQLKDAGTDAWILAQPFKGSPQWSHVTLLRERNA